MHPALETVHRSYAEALAGVSAAEAQARPDGNPDQWCAQELIEHLILTFRSTAAVLEERLRKGRPTQAPVTPEHETRWRRTIATGYFPQGGKAPDGVRPGQIKLGALSGAELAQRFRLEIENMDSLLDQCAEKFGAKPMASHFAFGPLSPDQWREFHAVHARHHLTQLLNILAGVQANLRLTEKTASTT